MKKNFLKKLAFTMAFATAFTALSPAAGVFAAKAPSLTVGKTLTLLLGTDRESHDINVNNKVKGSTYKWTTSNKAVATVDKNGIVEGQKTGSAKVTLKITLPTKKTKTLTTTVDVKDNIKEVKVNNKEVVDNKLEKVLVAGEKFDFNRTIVSTFGGNTKAHKGAVTRWEVLDADKKATENASADDAGNFVATVPGTYFVSAVSFQSTAKYKEWLKSGDAKLVTAQSEAVEVTVAPSITGVTQVTPTEITLTFDADMSKVINKDNLVIELNDATKQRQIVEKVTFADADKGLKATVNTYLEFKDGATYAISVKDTKLTGEFKASKGEAVRLEILEPSTVVFGTETEIKYGIYDANNVRIANTGATLTIKEGTANGYIVGNKINIFEKDKTVVVEASYSTGKVDTEKYELIYLKDVKTITSREALPTVVKTSKHTVATEAPKNWDDFKANTNLGLNDTGYKLFVQVTFDVDGKEEKSTTGFTYESMDLTKLIVGTDGTLVPVAAGTAHVKVTKDNLSVIVPVVVGANRKAVSWSFDANSKQVSNNVGADDTIEFKASAKDNYGADYAVGTIKVTPMNEGSVPVSVAKGVVKFAGKDFAEAKTYQYKVEFEDLVSMVTVVVRDGRTDTDVKNWTLSVPSTKVNTARDNDDHKGAEVVKFELLGYNKSGVLVARNTNPSVSAVAGNPSNDGVVGSVSGGKEFVLTSTSGVRVVSGATLDVVVKAKAGTYLFEAKDASGTILTRNAIVVEDTQAKATVAQTKISVKADGTDLLEAVRSAFDAYVGADKVNGQYIISATAKDSKGNAVGATVAAGNIVVTEVEVAQVFGTNVVITKVTVNRALTITK